MVFYSASREQQRTSAEPLVSPGILQRRCAFNHHAFDSDECTDLHSPEQSFNPGSIGMFAASRFNRDFSRVRLQAKEALQTLPSRRTSLMVQRFPKNEGEASAATEPVAGTTPRPTSTVEPIVEAPTPEETPALGLIVEDSTTDMAPGQMRKSEFLAQLRTEVCRTAEAAMAGTGRTTADCPYLDYWFGYYIRKDSAHIERAIHRYAPETASVTTARGYIPIIVGRVRRAVDTWVRTGEVTGVPEGVPTSMPWVGASGGERAASSSGPVMAKTRDGGVRSADNPQAIQAELGDGRPLDGGVRSRMESAFGMDFSHVRTHTDTTAAGLSNCLNARAFTVGEHVAFGSGEYQPGTLIGDALIAHEMAHVVQQRGASHSGDYTQMGGDAKYSCLEEDADISEVSAVASLLTGVKGVARNALPRLRSGLRLSSCKKGEEKVKELAKECIGAKEAKIITLDRTHPKSYLETAGCAPGVMSGKVEFYYQGEKFFVLPIVGGVFYGPIGSVFHSSTPGACKTVQARILDKEGNEVATVSKTVTDKRLFPECE